MNLTGENKGLRCSRRAVKGKKKCTMHCGRGRYIDVEHEDESSDDSGDDYRYMKQADIDFLAPEDNGELVIDVRRSTPRIPLPSVTESESEQEFESDSESDSEYEPESESGSETESESDSEEYEPESEVEIDWSEQLTERGPRVVVDEEEEEEEEEESIEGGKRSRGESVEFIEPPPKRVEVVDLSGEVECACCLFLCTKLELLEKEIQSIRETMKAMKSSHKVDK